MQTNTYKSDNFDDFDIKELLITELKNQKNINDSIIEKNEYNKSHDYANASNTSSSNKNDDTSINIESIFGFSKKAIVKALNPNYKKTYLFLDRRFRYSESLDKTTTTWVFQNNYNLNPGSVNAIGPIRDIVSMRIYDMNINILDTTYVCPQKIMTVYIPEFSTQSFIPPIEQNQTKDSRFHFWGTLRTNLEQIHPPNYDLLFWRGADLVGEAELNYRYTDGNNGLFEFTNPITTIDKLSVSFGYPYQKMPLHEDTFSFVYSAPTTAPYGSYGAAFIINMPVATDIPYGTDYLNRVYITNFMTDNPVADAVLINLLNNPPDGIVYVSERYDPGNTQMIVYPPNSYFNYIDFPAMVGNQISGTIYFDFYRFYVALELTYIKS